MHWPHRSTKIRFVRWCNRGNLRARSFCRSNAVTRLLNENCPSFLWTSCGWLHICCACLVANGTSFDLAKSFLQSWICASLTVRKFNIAARPLVSPRAFQVIAYCLYGYRFVCDIVFYVGLCGQSEPRLPPPPRGKGKNNNISHAKKYYSRTIRFWLYSPPCEVTASRPTRWSNSISKSVSIPCIFLYNRGIANISTLFVTLSQ